MNAVHKQKLNDGRTAPDANEEYLIYQTIVGAWPWKMDGHEDREQFLKRLKDYCTKALSEAKVHLSWTNPDPEYLNAVHKFIEAILVPQGRPRETRFVHTLKSFLPPVQFFGAVNSLSQLVLKIASPGVPDFYQGTELWDLSLVDPDNRRPVNYQERMEVLQALREQAEREGPARVCADVLLNVPDGRIKLWTIHRALSLRNELHSLFRKGEYIPLNIEGDKQENALAFLRQDAVTKESVLAVVPRFACSLMGQRVNLPFGDVWGKAQIALPDQRPKVFENVFTGETVQVPDDGVLRLRDLFTQFPVVLLRSRNAPEH